MRQCQAMNQKIKSRLWLFLRAIPTVSLVVLTWVVSIFLASRISLKDLGVSGQPELADLAAVLFGAASIALFALSILIALLAIFGWQAIQANLRESVERATSAKAELLESELRGRVFSVLGYTVGEICHSPDQIKATDPRRLRTAVQLCEQGHALLQKVGGPGEAMALNNLVFYASLLGDDARQDFLLRNARRLREEAQKHHAVNLQLTYCRVVLQLKGSRPDEKKEARELLTAILESPGTSADEKREAKLCLSSPWTPHAKS